VFDSKNIKIEALTQDINRYITDEKIRNNILEELKKEME
jgi:hypothetical protein